MILNALRVALRIFSGKVILIFRVCRTLQSAPNAIFTGGAAMVKEQSKSQNAVDLYDPTGEKRI